MPKKRTIKRTEVKRTGTLRQGRGRLETTTYREAGKNNFVDVSRKIENTSGIGKNRNVIDKSVKPNPRGVTIKARIQANPFTPNRKNKK